MKYRYKFHPYEYALGENEKFYSDMEARGWRLVKRGGYLSKFIQAEPQRVRYRIEVVSSRGYMENGCTMPPEQRAVYEDCGWEYITGRQLLHVFRAPEGSSAPEFYADPAEQAATLKTLRQQAMLAWVPLVVILMFNLFWSHYPGGLRRNLSLWYGAFIEQTAVVTAYILIILQALFVMLRGARQINRTYRRLKKGVPLDHNPQGRLIWRSTVSTGLTVAALALVVLLAVIQWVGTESEDLPLEADGPYLLFRDLGYDMERRPVFHSIDRESSITRTSSLLADYWDIYESVGSKSVNNWMYQDIYRLRSPKMAQSFAAALRNTTTFGESAEDCVCYVLPDMTAWVYNGMEIIAVSGNMAAHITWVGSGWAEPDPEPLLEALLERWKEYGAR